MRRIVTTRDVKIPCNYQYQRVNNILSFSCVTFNIFTSVSTFSGYTPSSRGPKVTIANFGKALGSAVRFDSDSAKVSYCD